MPIYTIYYVTNNQNAHLFAQLTEYGKCEFIERIDEQDYYECKINTPEKINYLQKTLLRLDKYKVIIDTGRELVQINDYTDQYRISRKGRKKRNKERKENA
jgi:hypothetical protein